LVLFRKDRTQHQRKLLAGVSGGGIVSKGAAWFKGREGPAQLKALTLNLEQIHVPSCVADTELGDEAAKTPIKKISHIRTTARRAISV